MSTEEKKECYCLDPRQAAALRTQIDGGPWLTPEQERDLRDPDIIFYPKMRQIFINRYHYIRIAFCPFCGVKL